MANLTNPFGNNSPNANPFARNNAAAVAATSATSTPTPSQNTTPTYTPSIWTNTLQGKAWNAGIPSLSVKTSDPNQAAIVALQAQIDKLANTPKYDASDSRSVLRGLLSNYGFDSGSIESLVGQVTGYLTTYDPQTIATALIPQTEEYKKRFSGNQERIKNGLAALSASEYLALEKSYAQALDYYKLPAGFYDDPKTDFASWIGQDVSAAEITSRAEAAFNWANNVDPNVKKSLKDYYGVGDAEIAAYALDRTRATTVIQNQYKATQIGAEALRSQLDVGRQFSEKLVGANVSAEQARQAFDTTAQNKEAFGKLATISGSDLTTGQLIESQLNLNASASKEVKSLASQERARFSGQAGDLRTLRANVSGSY